MWKLLYDFVIYFRFQTFCKHIYTIMLKNETSQQMIIGIKFLGFTDNIIENEIYISSTDLIKWRIDRKHDEPLCEIRLPLKIWISGDLNIVEDEDVDGMNELWNLFDFGHVGVGGKFVKETLV